jgi:mannosyltransferase OCH1-like enzyme
MIPKIIHRIWFDFGNGTEIPETSKEHVEKCHRLHPDWEVK